MPDNPEIKHVRHCFEALTRGDFVVLEASLAEDARWRTVQERATNCEGRDTVIGIMTRNLAGRLRGTIEEMTGRQSGERRLPPGEAIR
jgi:ketosteroid isomerase-like protein